METIVGTRIHEEILALIDRAEVSVVLVSPFIRMWPDLRRALARVVARGVEISLITRGPRGGPKDEDLAVFRDLEAKIDEVPDLHLKAYLSEKEAIHTSVNLTRQSVDKSLESSLLFTRNSEPEGWNSVYEIWHKTLDDAARVEESEPTEFEQLLKPLREGADAGDMQSRTLHKYCIACGSTASENDEYVVCLRCRAKAMAADLDPDGVTGSRCTRCNGLWRLSTADRPFCDPCYRADVDRYRRRPARWYVHGATGSIEAWSRLDGLRGPGVELHAKAQRAVGARWGVLMPPGGWLAATLTASTTKPLALWTAAMPPAAAQVAMLDGIVLERVPAKATPACRDLPEFPWHQSLHLAFSWGEVPATSACWEEEQVLATWDTTLPRSADAQKLTTPEWVLRLLLPPRQGFKPLTPCDPSRSHLQVKLALVVPVDLRARWKEAASSIIPVLLGALHTYDEADVRDWLSAATPRVLASVATSLALPSPLGPAKLLRDARGHVRALPHRSDRVTAIQVNVESGEAWHVRASVSKVRKLALN